MYSTDSISSASASIFVLYSVSAINSGARPYDDAGLGLSGIGELQRLGPILSWISIATRVAS